LTKSGMLVYPWFPLSMTSSIFWARLSGRFTVWYLYFLSGILRKLRAVYFKNLVFFEIKTFFLPNVRTVLFPYAHFGSGGTVLGAMWRVKKIGNNKVETFLPVENADVRVRGRRGLAGP
jgi:hypothetical protein